MRRSTVRELLKLTANRDVISFAGGLPAPEVFPVEAARQAAERVLTTRATDALQYGETEGVGELRDYIAERVGNGTIRIDRDHVLIVSGSQQALDLLGRVLLDSGDEVFVENPTYLALLQAFGLWGVRYHAVPSDDEGMCVDAIALPIPKRAKVLYATPNFQNPQGTTLALERRLALVRLAERSDMVVVEDDPYRMLSYDGDPPPSLLEIAARSSSMPCGSVVQVGTFSKVLAPGLRVGWVVAHPELIDKLVQAKQSADLHTSTLTQHIVLEMLRAGVVERQLPILRAIYRERRDAMLAGIAAHFPEGTTWTRPGGGMFVMVRLAGTVDTRALLPAALEQGVAFVPGADFYLDKTGLNTMRLNFTHVDPHRISVGLQRLGQLVRAFQKRPR